MNRVILLLVDGLRPDVAEAALARGELPHLRAMVGKTGEGVSRGITVFPSTTSVAYLPFLTGCTPGRCNIPSIRWIDRVAYAGHWWREREAVRSYCGYQAGRLDRDVSPGIRTIFELIPESLGIFTPLAKGLSPARDPARTERRFWGVLAHWAKWHQPSDDAASRHLLRGIDAGWRFIFAQFPAVDGYTHQSTPTGERVLRALRKVDDTVGRMFVRLRSRGELDDTLVLLVSDHGSSTVHTHLDLADWFRRQGVKTLSHPVLWERNPSAAVMVAGNGSAMVYAQPDTPRRERWSLPKLRTPAAFGVPHDLIAALVAEPAVAFVAAEERPGLVQVASGRSDGTTGRRDDGRGGHGGLADGPTGRRDDGRGGHGGLPVGPSDRRPVGTAEIQRVDGTVGYRPLTGDPLLLGGPLHLTEAEWLERTWDAAYPDACVQLLDQFRAGRAGDLIVVAREGYDLRQRFEVPEHKSGHGSLFRSHMQVPVWANVPAPTGPIRTVDLFPGMLEWLGEPVPEGIDGQAVWSPGRAPAVA